MGHNCESCGNCSAEPGELKIHRPYFNAFKEGRSLQEATALTKCFCMHEFIDAAKSVKDLKIILKEIIGPKPELYMCRVIDIEFGNEVDYDQFFTSEAEARKHFEGGHMWYRLSSVHKIGA